VGACAIANVTFYRTPILFLDSGKKADAPKNSGVTFFRRIQNMALSVTLRYHAFAHSKKDS
jgi:hypothetical protein